LRGAIRGRVAGIGPISRIGAENELVGADLGPSTRAPRHIGRPRSARSCGCDELARLAQAERFALQADDVAVVEQAVEDRSGDGLVGEEARPALELDVGRDDQTALVVLD
jgi:hypothetical protein